MKKLLLSMLCLLIPAAALAQTERPFEVKTELGYTFYSTYYNPQTVNEFSLSHSSPTVMAELNIASAANKLLFIVNAIEKDALEYDLHWYYKDSLRFEAMGQNFVHWLEHKQLSAGYDLSPSADYILDMRMRKFELKLKPFVYPFHVRLNVENIEKDGLTQKRFYGPMSPSVLYNVTPEIFSRSAAVDYDIENVALSVDGLAGGVNVFLIAETNELREKAGQTDDGLRQLQGIDQHSYTLKLTSNQSGQLSWALAFSLRDVESRARDAAGRNGVDIQHSSATALLSYNPTQRLKMSLKMFYEDSDKHVPDAWSYSAVTYVPPDAFNQTKHCAVLKTRYLLSDAWKALVDLKYRQVTRSGEEQYGLTDESTTRSGIVGLDGKLGNRLNIKLSQSVEKNENPVYRSTPENQYRSILGIGYDISDTMGLTVEGVYTRELNDDPAYLIQKNRAKQYTATYWYTPAQGVSVSFHTQYEHQKYDSDIQFGTAVNPADPQAALKSFAERTPYRSTTLNSSLNVSTSLSKRDVLYTDLYYLRGYGTYTPARRTGTIALTPAGTYTFDTAGLDSLARTDFYQTGITVGNKFNITPSSSVRCELGYRDQQDRSMWGFNGGVTTAFLSWEQKW